MIRFLFLLILVIPFSKNSFSQNIYSEIPSEIDTGKKYLFYLHGGIVQNLGPNAVSEYYGPYEYFNILEELKSQSFEVISEVRPKESSEAEYAKIVGSQIKKLLNQNVPAENIVVVGASLGAYIAVETALIVKQPEINYAMLGLCSNYALELFQDRSKSLCGNFLSLFESSDEKGSCVSIFSESDCRMRFEEIELNMGIGHGFLYKPFDEWVNPLVNWINN